MSESLASNEHRDEGMVTDQQPTSLEAVFSIEPQPRIVVEKFLIQCMEDSIHPRENLATFIAAALHGETSDGWITSLREISMSPNDEQYEALIKDDDVFKDIFELLVKSKPIVGRGESMSAERRALRDLMDLRAGEVISTEGSPSETSDESWRLVLAKLFPDLT